MKSKAVSVVKKDSEAPESRKPELFNMLCPICGKRFHLKPSHAKLGHNHYCSKECHRKAKMEYMKGEKNHQYGLKGALNASWSGGRKLSCYGYMLVQCIGHPFAVGKSEYVFEHRLVAEKYLLTDENSVVINGKRYLSPEYFVHHINENRLDNRPENLRVMKPSEHQHLHSTEQNKTRSRDEFGRFTS